MKPELGKQLNNDEEEDKMLKVWRIVFNKRENEMIKEDEKLIEFVSKYSQDIKTLFNLLKKDKMTNKFMQIGLKSKGITQKLENEKQNENETPNPLLKKTYKIKHYRSGLNNNHDYVVRLSSTVRGTFKIRTENNGKLKPKLTTNKLITAKSLPVEIQKTTARMDKPVVEQRRVMMKLNTVDLGGNFNK